MTEPASSWFWRGRLDRRLPGVSDSADRADELVPLLGARANVARGVRVVGKGRTYLADAEIQAALEVDESVVAPDRAAELLARYEAAGALEQDRESLRGLTLQSDGSAVPRELEQVGIEFKQAEAVDPWHALTVAHRNAVSSRLV